MIGDRCRVCKMPVPSWPEVKAHGREHQVDPLTIVVDSYQSERIRKVVVPKGAGRPRTVKRGVKVVPEVTRTGVRADDLTREQWLLRAVAAMRPDFTAVGREVPEVRISIGWPGGRTARMDPLGQCWYPAAVGDGVPAIFITPSQDDPVQILATTRHEMVHAAGEMNHRAGFRKLAAQVGFDPQPGATGVSSTYRTPALTTTLEALYAKLGPFPHSPVNKGMTGNGKAKVQGTRMLKVTCEYVEARGIVGQVDPPCGYTVRTTAKWLAVAIPNCPVHEGEQMTVEVK